MAYNSTINLGLPAIPEPADPKSFGDFLRVYNALRILSITVDSYTGAKGQDPQYYAQTPPAASILSQNSLRMYAKFGVAITAGQAVYLYDVAGVTTVGLASALTTAKPMRGWCSTTTAADSYGEVMLGGLMPLTGLVLGATYYLSNTAGGISIGPGTTSQKVGFAVDTTHLFVQPQLI